GDQEEFSLSRITRGRTRPASRAARLPGEAAGRHAIPHSENEPPDLLIFWPPVPLTGATSNPSAPESTQQPKPGPRLSPLFFLRRLQEPLEERPELAGAEEILRVPLHAEAEERGRI